MPQVDLTTLLRERQLRHPTQILRGVLEARTFTLTVRGSPWWIDGVFDLVFEAVSGGLLDLPLVNDPEDDEALEPFAVTPMADLPWAQPASHSLFCSAATPRPLRLYAVIADYLASAGAPTMAGQYLNGGARPDVFVETASTESYRVATAPPEIARIIRAELEAQGVPYTVQDHGVSSDDRLWVRLGDANIYCARAYAILPD